MADDVVKIGGVAPTSREALAAADRQADRYFGRGGWDRGVVRVTVEDLAGEVRARARANYRCVELLPMGGRLRRVSGL